MDTVTDFWEAYRRAMANLEACEAAVALLKQEKTKT